MKRNRLGQAVAAVAAHGEHEGDQDQQHGREGEDEVHQFRDAHEDVRQRCREQGADGHLHRMAAAALFPGDRQAFDGHGQDHHREQGDRQAALEAELVAEQADHRDHHHHEGQHHREARQHLQLQVLEIGAQRQAQGGDHGEQGDTPLQAGLAEGQGDQHRGEGAESLQADQVAQDQDHQHADRDHDHDLEGLLGGQRQAVQGVLEEGRLGVLVGQLGQADGVHLAAVQAEADLGLLAAVDGHQRLIAKPPDQAIGGQALFAGDHVEIQPVLAVEAAQPQFRALLQVGDQTDGVDPLHRHVGDGQQGLDDMRFLFQAGVAGHQQLDVVVVAVVGALDGFADEGLDVGRVLANGGQQGFCGDLLRAFQGQAVAEDRAFLLGLLAGVALGQHQAVVQGLLAVGAAGGPGHLAIAVGAIDADAVIVGDEAFVEADVVLAQRRNEHLHLDRGFRRGDEVDLGIDVPEVIGFGFGNGNTLDENLIGGDRHTQGQQDGDQDFQMQVERAHVVYSAGFASGLQPGFPAEYFKLGSTSASNFFKASEPIKSGYWNALRSVRFTSMVRIALPMQTCETDHRTGGIGLALVGVEVAMAALDLADPRQGLLDRGVVGVVGGQVEAHPGFAVALETLDVAGAEGGGLGAGVELGGQLDVRVVDARVFVQAVDRLFGGYAQAWYGDE